MQRKRVKTNAIAECNVAIVKFRNPDSVKVEGVLKQNTFDFIVQEIDLNQQVVEYKGVDLPLTETESILHEEEWFNSISDNESIQKYYTLDEIKILKDDLLSIINKKQGNLFFKMIADKQDRKSIHFLFKSVGNLYTQSKDNLIQVCYGTERKNNKPFINWKERGGSYLEFCLIKSNIDTMQAVFEIAKRSKLQSKSFSYAGTKDKRAFTSQLVRCYRVESKRIANIPFNFSKDSIKKIKLCNFKYVEDPLRLGDCYGNRFVVVLRDVCIRDSEFTFEELTKTVNNSFTALRDNGFINYFGMQRFGNSSVGTHDLGKLVILKGWRNLIQAILDPRIGESPCISEARQIFKDTNDAKLAYDAFPNSCIAERSVLSHLKESKNDFHGAFMKIPRNLRTMYAHAYQSYIWNTMVNKRIDLFGFNVAIGDLVLDHAIDLERNTRGVKVLNPIKVTESNIERYSIYDVVLTLPGSCVEFPCNLEAEYSELLEKEGIDMDAWSDDPQLNLSGTYRHMVSRAVDLVWDIYKYDKMEPMHTLFGEEPISGNNTEGANYALKVQVSLKSSSYVTMMLREVASTVDRLLVKSPDFRENGEFPQRN
eukprot:NODE_238_length_13323_cov_0.463854.p3 type:complete len:595 gc:universal NODE_238_length_13323_cov_0.463854:4494-6278(+)